MLKATPKNRFFLIPKNWFSLVYEISDERIQNERIYLNLYRLGYYKANLDIGGKIYKIYPDLGQGVHFGMRQMMPMPIICLLEDNGIIIARYKSTAFLNATSVLGFTLVNCEGELIYNEQKFILKTKSYLKQQFSLLENYQEIGSLYAERKFLLRDLIADLPSNIPIEIQVFLLWIILCAWKVANAMGNA